VKEKKKALSEGKLEEEWKRMIRKTKRTMREDRQGGEDRTRQY